MILQCRAEPKIRHRASLAESFLRLMALFTAGYAVHKMDANTRTAMSIYTPLACEKKRYSRNSPSCACTGSSAMQKVLLSHQHDNIQAVCEAGGRSHRNSNVLLN